MPKLEDSIWKRIRQADATLPNEDYPFPLYVIVEPVNICNLRCIMCPSPLQTRPRGVMSIDVWKKIIDEIADTSPVTVVWPAIMGESLIAGDRFGEMLDYVCRRAVKWVWNTNAILLTDEWIARILSAKPKEIIIGLDALTEATYLKIRRGGDFNRAVENTLKLIRKKSAATRVTVQFIEQDLNRHEKDDFASFWLSRGAAVKIRPMLGWGNAVPAPDLVLKQEEHVRRCPWLIRTVSIHWNGVVVQCDGDWDQQWPVGNVTQNSIREIWNGELARRRARHRNLDFDFHPCKECKDWQAGLSTFLMPNEKKR